MFNNFNNKRTTRVVLEGIGVEGDIILNKIKYYDISRRPEGTFEDKSKHKEDFLLWQIEGEITPLTDTVFLVNRGNEYVVVNTILGKNWHFNHVTYNEDVFNTEGTILVSKKLVASKNTGYGIEVVSDNVLYRFNPVTGTVESDIYSESQDRRIDKCNYYGETYPAIGLSVDSIQFNELMTKEVYENMLFGKPNAYTLEGSTPEYVWESVSLRATRK